MIVATFNRDQAERIVSFEITGHAGFGEIGEDIICAGVSAQTYGAINSIGVLAEIRPIIDIDEVDGGYLYAAMPEEMSSEQLHTVQILLEGLRIGLVTIENEYSEYITVNTVNL